MKITVSSNSGFCFGVKRALDIAEKSLRRQKKVYSLGPIIHNPQVVEEFSGKGLEVIKDIKDIRQKSASVLIPSHGISPAVMKKRNFTFIDTTCPFVRKVRDLVKGLKKKGFFIIIVGDKSHPEVRGLRGIAGRSGSLVIRDKDEAKKLNLAGKRVALISQTTASVFNFKEVASEIAKKNPARFVSFNTVCRNTIERRRNAERIAKRVEVMFIMGGRESANTRKLVTASRRINKNTYHIESEKDLKKNFLKNKKKIGIATGASTPPYAIREVVEKISTL